MYVDREYKTWVIKKYESDEGGICFGSIKNDSLGVGGPRSAFLGTGSIWVRDK